MSTPAGRATALRGRTVVVGVSGGIAAYKACELVRWLRARDAAVIVVMSRAATEFVTPLTFQTLSGNPVVLDLWGNQSPPFRLPEPAAKKMRGRVEHVDVAEAADVMVMAPATADLMARLVHGEAPDALTCVALACRAPIVVCPSMDLEMWRKPVTRANVQSLASRGMAIVGPESGPLASGLEGPGRLAGIEAIGEAVTKALERRTSLAGVRVLVGAGRTEEPVDPVRVFTNRSSGRMGYAVAEAARDRGADVTLVTGPASVDPPAGVTIRPVTTAAEMESAMLQAVASADLVVMAAAVADYRPARAAAEKIKRQSKSLTIALEPTADILAAMGRRRKPRQVIVGFALETSRGVARARVKLREKRADLIVLNAPADSLGRDTNRVTLVDDRGVEKLPTLSKREVAERLLDRALDRWRRAVGRAPDADVAGAVRGRVRRVGRARSSRPARGRANPPSRGEAARKPS